MYQGALAGDWRLSAMAKENEMKRRMTNQLLATLAATAVMSALGAPAWAQSGAHSHDAGAQHRLALDNGRK